MRGPVVYCLEGVDNGADIKCVSVDTKSEFTVGEKEFLVPSIIGNGFIEEETDALYYEANDNKKAIPLKFIPYFAFANRGESDMIVWVMCS